MVAVMTTATATATATAGRWCWCACIALRSSRCRCRRNNRCTSNSRRRNIIRRSAGGGDGGGDGLAVGVVGGEPVADLDEGEVLLALLVCLDALLGVADDEERAADLARGHAALVHGVLHLDHELLALAPQRVRLRHRLVRARDLALRAEALRARHERRQLRVNLRDARRDLLHRQLVRVLQRHRALLLQLRHAAPHVALAQLVLPPQHRTQPRRHVRRQSQNHLSFQRQALPNIVLQTVRCVFTLFSHSVVFVAVVITFSLFNLLNGLVGRGNS